MSPTVIFYELSPIIISSQRPVLGGILFPTPVTAELPVPPRDATSSGSMTILMMVTFFVHGGNGSLYR